MKDRVTTHLTRKPASLPLCGERVTGLTAGLSFQLVFLLNDKDTTVRFAGFYHLPLRLVESLEYGNSRRVKICAECSRLIRCGCWPDGGQPDDAETGTWCGDGSCPKCPVTERSGL